MPEIYKLFNSAPGESRNKLLQFKVFLKNKEYFNLQNPIHFDDLLIKLHPAYNTNPNVPLPLCFVTSGDKDSPWREKWVWAASAAIFPEKSVTDNPYIVSADYAVFYAVPDDSFGEIARTLKKIDNLKSFSMGEIDHWEVTLAEGKTFEACCVQNGITVRNIPANFCRSGVYPQLCAIRHPYDVPSVHGFPIGSMVDVAPLTFRGKKKNGEFKIIDQI